MAQSAAWMSLTWHSSSCHYVSYVPPWSREQERMVSFMSCNLAKKKWNLHTWLERTPPRSYPLPFFLWSSSSRQLWTCQMLPLAKKWLLRMFRLSLKRFCVCAAWIWSLREPARRVEQASKFSVWPVSNLWDYKSWNYIEKNHSVTLQAERNIATSAVVHSHCCCICATTYDARCHVLPGSFFWRIFFLLKVHQVTSRRMPTPSFEAKCFSDWEENTTKSCWLKFNAVFKQMFQLLLIFSSLDGGAPVLGTVSALVSTELISLAAAER